MASAILLIMNSIKQIAKDIMRKTGYELHRLAPVVDTPLYERLYGKDSVKYRRFYNISAGGHLSFGCGISHPCWTNVDVDKPWSKSRGYNPELDIAHDLLSLEPLPIESKSAELVHSRFTIEHITDEAAELLFSEVHRILKSDGLFKVTVPNVDLDYRAYMQGDRSHFNWVEMFSTPENFPNYGLKEPMNTASLEQIFLLHFAANASTHHLEGPEEKIDDDTFKNLFKELPYEEALNYCSRKCLVEVAKKYRQNHINWWNHDKLIRKLKSAGFKDVYLVSSNQSASPVFRNKGYFDNVWQSVAMYVEAVR